MAKKPKHKTSNIVKNSIKTLKIVHIKKKIFFKPGLERYINETMEELSSYSKILPYFS